jgi:hypothetical protein
MFAWLRRRIIGPALFLSGFLFATISWEELELARTLASRGQVAHARVLASHEGTDDGAPTTFATISYVVGGATIRREARFTPGLYDDDGTLDIVYDPNDPNRYMVVGTQVSPNLSYLRIAGGVVLGLIGVAVFFSAFFRRVD